ncbi:hypothetical protein BLNAU_2890 [Blattamonas nauphoetae]|uniref:Uncharacterized protein n=1 Tax=Blattamonas nauphoetae TaxID=2049346 RepID=A0ABQ9YEP0_9EUKA|nr:hypothetical protein BLNAU_2890 [Blattamonas nauphoetae]
MDDAESELLSTNTTYGQNYRKGPIKQSSQFFNLDETYTHIDSSTPPKVDSISGAPRPTVVESIIPPKKSVLLQITTDGASYPSSVSFSGVHIIQDPFRVSGMYPVCGETTLKDLPVTSPTHHTNCTTR